jgi:type VI secretion system protein ImpC
LRVGGASNFDYTNFGSATMPEPAGPDRIGFEIRTDPADASRREPVSERPFRILILGDFGGQGGGRSSERPGAPLSGRQPIPVDRDTLDEVLARIAPTLELGAAEAGAGKQSLTLRFSELDDFHPDRLYERVPEFRMLQALREQAADPRSARRPVPAEGSRGAAAAEAPRPTAEPLPGGSLLDRIIGAESDPPSRPASPAAGAGAPAPSEAADLQEYINRLMAQHAVPETSAGQQAAVSRLDALATDAMRAVLHHADFQALESLSRGVDFLVRRIETGPELQVHLLDASRAEVMEDQAPDRPLEDTALYRLLVEETAGTAGAEPWSLLVGAYTFGRAPTDASALGRLAELGRAAGAPWLAGAHPRLVGAASFPALAEPESWSGGVDPAWAALRRHGSAAYLGLVLPRFLLRLPYGEETDACEAFQFEEVAGEPEHGAYLWGNPALAAAVLLAESFTAAGWSMRPGSHLDLRGLPLHLYRSGVEAVAKPCAEVWFRERAAVRVLERGVMPLVSMKDSDAIRLVRFQSLADPPSALAGPWES